MRLDGRKDIQLASTNYERFIEIILPKKTFQIRIPKKTLQKT